MIFYFRFHIPVGIDYDRENEIDNEGNENYHPNNADSFAIFTVGIILF